MELLTNESSPGPGEAGCGRHVARAAGLVNIDNVSPGLGVSRPRHRDLGLEEGRCKQWTDGTIELSTKLCLLLVERLKNLLKTLFLTGILYCEFSPDIGMLVHKSLLLSQTV